MQQTTNLKKHSNKLFSVFLNNFSKEVIATTKDLSIENVLDVGCGEGFVLQKLVDAGIGKSHAGIESEKETIENAKKIHPGLHILQGNIYQLPYKDNSFDLVLCTEVLEHLDKPRDGLQELIRVAKKYILVTVPNEPWFTIQRILRGKNILKLGAHPEHIQHWTSNVFEKFVSQEKEIKLLVKRHPSFVWAMILMKKSTLI